MGAIDMNESKYYWCTAEKRTVSRNACNEICWTHHEVYGKVMLADCEDCDHLGDVETSDGILG